LQGAGKSQCQLAGAGGSRHIVQIRAQRHRRLRNLRIRLVDRDTSGTQIAVGRRQGRRRIGQALGLESIQNAGHVTPVGM